MVGIKGVDMSLEVEELPCGATRAKGFCVRALQDFIFVADLGQPAQTRGGIYIPDSGVQYYRYRYEEWRIGHVVAMGPGRWDKAEPFRWGMPDIKVGDLVNFSRKVGTRFSHIRFKHPAFPGVPNGLYVRVIDPEKAIAEAIEFKPWWNVEEGIVDPDVRMSG